ncbi:hypothetical protein HDV00_004825 [Rhizophlyctis rosea]|nr:hypothetical protein HDV00_004825 [Rhizophlyctis rosea]
MCFSLSPPAGNALFEEVTLLERLDARTSVRRVRSRLYSTQRAFTIVTQTAATSSTYVSLSTCASESTDDSPLNLQAWAVERLAQGDGLNATCFILGQTQHEEDFIFDALSQSITAATSHLSARGFAPYLQDCAPAVKVLGEFGAEKSWQIEWTTEEEEDGAAGGDTDGSKAVLEIRIDHGAWVERTGINVDYSIMHEDSSVSPNDSDIGFERDGEGGLIVSCSGLKAVNRLLRVEMLDGRGGVVLLNRKEAPKELLGFHADAVNDADKAASTSVKSIPASPQPKKRNVKPRFPPPPTTLTSNNIHLPNYPSRYSGDIARAFETFNYLLANPDEFTFVGSQRDVAMYGKEVAGHPTGVYKGVGVFQESSVRGLWDLKAVVENVGTRRGWDVQFESAEILEQLSPITVLSHVHFKAVWPTSQRDAVIASVQCMSEDRYQFVSVSVGNEGEVEDPVPKAGVVRAHVTLAGWDVERVRGKGDGGSSSGLARYRITYIAQTHPGGWLPSAVLKMVSVQTPLMVASVVDYLRKYAPPPCIAVLNGCRVSRMNYDQDSGDYEVDFAVVASAGGGEEGGEDVRGLEVRVDLERWGKGNVDVMFESGQVRIGEGANVAWVQDSAAYGEGAVVLRIWFEEGIGDANVKLRVRKGGRETGLVVNGVTMDYGVESGEVGREDEGGEERSSRAGSTPVAVRGGIRHRKNPSLSSISPGGGATGWGSPGRLSVTSTFAGTAWDTRMDEKHDGAVNGASTLRPRNSSLALQDRPPDLDRTRSLYNAAEGAMNRLAALRAETYEWMPVSSLRSGLVIEKKLPVLGDESGDQTSVWKGVKVVEGFSPEETFAALRSFECRRAWDETMESGKQLEYCGDGIRTTYATYRGYFPMSRRDIVAVEINKLVPSTATGTALPTILSASTSIPENLLSDSARRELLQNVGVGKMRANLVLAGWVLEAIDPYEDPHHYPIPSTRATYFVKLDLGGSIPLTVQGVLLGAVAKSPASLESFLKMQGAPPYVRWPGPSRNMSGGLNSVKGPEDEDLDPVVTLRRKREDIRVVKEEAVKSGAGRFEVGFEAGWPKKLKTGNDVGGEDGGETFHLEMEESGVGRTVKEELERDRNMLVEIVVDVSRQRFGYDVGWKSEAGEGLGGGAGPELRIEVAEIPPVPTHSATHLGAGGGEGSGSPRGGSIVEGAVGRISDTWGALAGRRWPGGGVGQSGGSAGVTKHAIRVYAMVGSAEMGDRMRGTAGDGDDVMGSESTFLERSVSVGARDRFYRLSADVENAGGGERWFRGHVTIVFADKLREGQTLGEFQVLVGGVKAVVTKAADWRGKEELVRKLSRSSRDLLRVDIPGLVGNRKRAFSFPEKQLFGVVTDKKADSSNLQSKSKYELQSGVSDKDLLGNKRPQEHQPPADGIGGSKPARVDTGDFGNVSTLSSRVAGESGASTTRDKGRITVKGGDRVLLGGGSIGRTEGLAGEQVVYSVLQVVLVGGLCFFVGFLLRLFVVDPFAVCEGCAAGVGGREVKGGESVGFVRLLGKIAEWWIRVERRGAERVG